MYCYKYSVQCGDVRQHAWLVQGEVDNKDVSSGKTTSVCSLLDAGVFSLVRSVGRLGGSRMGFSTVVVGLKVILLELLVAILLHQLVVPVPSPLDGNSLPIIADDCGKTLGQYAGEIEQ